MVVLFAFRLLPQRRDSFLLLLLLFLLILLFFFASFNLLSAIFWEFKRLYVFHLFLRNWLNIINACFRPPLHYYFNFHYSFKSNIQLHLSFPSFTYRYRTIYLHHINDVYLFTVDWEILSSIWLYTVFPLSFVYQILCFFNESWFLVMHL